MKRFSLGTKNKGLKQNADGSLTIYVQPQDPGGDKQSNWLPAPKGVFSLYIRAYWPDAKVVSGDWIPPTVEKVQ